MLSRALARVQGVGHLLKTGFDRFLTNYLRCASGRRTWDLMRPAVKIGLLICGTKGAGGVRTREKARQLT